MRPARPAASEARVHTVDTVPPTRTFLPFPPMTVLNLPAKAKKLTVERLIELVEASNSFLSRGDRLMVFVSDFRLCIQRDIPLVA
jgi:hypothetical protein